MPKPSCLVGIRPQGSRPPLFFVPGAGGVVSYLYPLARALDPEFLFRFSGAGPGRSIATPWLRRSDGGTVCGSVAGGSVARALFPGRPFLWSYVAHAMAQDLVARGLTIGLLAIIDTFAPGAVSIEATPRVDDGVYVSHLVAYLADILPEMPVPRYVLAGLSAEEQLAYIARRLEEANLFAEGTGIDFLRGYIDVVNTNVQMAEQYLPDSCQVYRSRCSGQPKGLVPCRRAAGIDEDFGWSQYSSQPVQVRYVPGNHHTAIKWRRSSIWQRPWAKQLMRPDRASGDGT